MIYAVIVTYNPKFKHLSEMIKNLQEAKVKVIIFDNTDDQKDMKIFAKKHSDVIFIYPDSNLGLGVAFNQAIKKASEDSEFEAILFFDQDSTIKTPVILKLIDSYEFLKENNIDVGVLGANPVDKDGNDYISNQKYNIFNDKFSVCEFVISSFSLVPYKVFSEVGFFWEDLFIDLVDSEFSFRCSSHGKLNLIDNGSQFSHEVGESRKKLLGRGYSISSPIRNYYQARNLILVGNKYGWIYFMLSKIAKRFIQVTLSGIYDRNLALRYKFFLKGLIHGSTGKSGKYI